MNREAAPTRLNHLFGALVNTYAELNEFIVAEWPETEPTYPPNLNQTLRYFISAMNSRARAAFILLQAGSHWESEIVLRSHLEAAVKCLTFARRLEVESLLKEYWEELLSSSDRKAALKAQLAGKAAPESGIDRQIFERLTNPDWFDVEPKANKVRRSELDHNWSLPELVKKLGSSAHTIERVKHLDAMMHGYGLQSEILHVSAKYYDLLMDRMCRGEDIEALENGHYCRQMVEPLMMTTLCIVMSLERLGCPRKTLRQPIALSEEFNRLTKPYSDAFSESQRDFYDN